METKKNFVSVETLNKLANSINSHKVAYNEESQELRMTLLNNIENILIEMNCPISMDNDEISSVYIYEHEYWEDEPNYDDYVETDYITKIFFNEDNGVTEFYTDWYHEEDDNDSGMDIRYLNSFDLLEIYQVLKKIYDNNY